MRSQIVMKGRRNKVATQTEDLVQQNLDRGGRVMVVNGRGMTLVYRVKHLTVYANQCAPRKVCR